MSAVVFFPLSLLFGLGLYLILPVLALMIPIFGVPAIFFAVWFLRTRDHSGQVVRSESSTKKGDAKFTGDFLFESVNLDAKDQREILSLAKPRIEKVLEALPSDVAFKLRAEKINQIWNLNVIARSISHTFRASSSGFSANEALLLLEPILHKQIQDWQWQRSFFQTSGQPIQEFLPPKEIPYSTYKVLIVDDDIDAAALASAAFKNLGCTTEVATTPRQAEKLLKRRDSDIIVLDWDLGDNTYASDVITRAVNSLNISSSEEISEAKVSKIVTYSSSDKQDIWLPNNVYFHHTDHWLKPVTYSDLEFRSRKLIESQLLAS